MTSIKRRRFLLGASAVMTTYVGRANATSLPRIVVLSLVAPEDQMLAFEEGLKSRGLVHGSTVTLIHRTAAGNRDALMDKAAEAVSLSPNVIVAVGGKAAVAAHKATKEIPIVAVSGSLAALGLVSNYSQPEGNVTGYSFFTLQLTEKRLEFLLQVNPMLRRLHVLLPSARYSAHAKALANLEKTLKRKGIDIVVVGVPHVNEIEAKIADVASSPEESLLMLPSVEFDSQARKIGGMIAKHRVIAMLPWKEYIEGGGLMSYSPDIVGIWREASIYVDRVLRGAKPSELPVIQSTLFELVINLRSAQALGLTVPATLLLRADRVIE